MINYLIININNYYFYLFNVDSYDTLWDNIINND